MLKNSLNCKFINKNLKQIKQTNYAIIQYNKEVENVKTK